MAQPRIVSLLPSATEIVCALGSETHLVGRSHECDYPRSIADRPVCTEPKFRVEATSRAVDRQVKDLLEQALSVYRVHAEVLRDLAPDVIVTQSQCEVCAVSEDELRAVVATWLVHTPDIVSLEASDLDGVFADIAGVAATLGRPEAGAAVVRRMRARVEDVAVQTRRVEERPNVACLEWLDPLMAAGNWMPELVELAGGHNLFGETGSHAPWLDWAALSTADPDVIVALPCGFDIARTRAELSALTHHPAWRDLRAVAHGRFYLLDGNQYFNRPGPRLADSLEILAEVLHPDLFDFGHEGRGWVRGPAA